MSFPASHTV